MLKRNYKKLWENMHCLISVFHPFANICLYLVRLKNVWFIGARIWPCSISNEWVLDISRRLGLFGLTFKIQIWRWNKIYCHNLDSRHFIFFVTYEWAQKAKGSVPGRFPRIDKCLEFTLDWSIFTQVCYSLTCKH